MSISYEIECNGAETIMKFACTNSVFHTFFNFVLIYPEGGLDTAKLFMGVTRNDTRGNIKGGATCNNGKQFKLLN